jgi:hypothetical protein
MWSRSQVPSLTGNTLLGFTQYAFSSSNVIRYTNDEVFENVPRLIPRILNSMPSPSPSHFSSWHVPPSETGFVLDTSTSGSQTSEQPAYTNLVHDFARHGDHCYGQDVFSPSRGYDSRAPELPCASPQFSVSPRGTIDPFIPGSTAHPIVYTDDTTAKLTSRVRRQCFNCKSRATTTWRRSMLMSGKWVCDFVCVVVEKHSVLNIRSQVCNKCGLFERAHAAPRPKAFPRRRRSRSPSGTGYRNTGAPLFNHFEYRHYDDCSFTGHVPSAVGSTCGDTNLRDPTWMTDIVSSTPAHLNPSHIVSPQPRTYHADSQFPLTIPTEAEYPTLTSHLSDRHLPM